MLGWEIIGIGFSDFSGTQVSPHLGAPIERQEFTVLLKFYFNKGMRRFTLLAELDYLSLIHGMFQQLFLIWARNLLRRCSLGM
jgi:hypothetical protein